MISEALRIGSGAAIGALARFAFLSLFGDQLWQVLVINLLGSLLTGLLRPGAFLGTGVLGGFTTYSTFIVLALAQNSLLAAGYICATVLGCVVAWLVGDQLHHAYRRREGTGG